MQKKEVVLRSAEDVAKFVDQQPTTRKSWLVVAIALGGVFADAYDFASLGVGSEPLKLEFGLSPIEVGGVTTAMAI